MSEAESTAVKRDMSEISANLFIYGWPFAAILLCLAATSIDTYFGDKPIVQWIKTGRMDGAAENFSSDSEFDGNRGNLQKGDVQQVSAGGSPQIGQEWSDEWGVCATYNSPDLLPGMSDSNGDGVRDTFDLSKPVVRTAWEMVNLSFKGSADGPFYIVVGGEIVEVRDSLSDPRFKNDANGKGVCVVD